MITRALLVKSVVLSLVAALAAWGCCETDTTILNIGPGANSGLFCPNGTTDVARGCGFAPNPVPANHLDIYVDSTSLPTSLDITRLIIGIPLATGAAVPLEGSLPSIDQVTVYNPYPTDPSPAVYGADRAANGCGLLESGETNAYHECLGGSPPSGGNSFANWYSAAQDLGLNPNRFALYYYNLYLPSIENLGNRGLYDIALTGNLPVGTMEIAYGCATGECSSYCYVTPFDNSGQVVPEPSTWALVSGAALLFAAARFRRKKA